MTIKQKIDAAWDSRTAKMDWSGLENVLVEILSSTESSESKVLLAKEALDAFTKRGHFAEEDVA